VNSAVEFSFGGSSGYRLRPHRFGGSICRYTQPAKWTAGDVRIVVRQENATKPAGSRTTDQAGPGPAVRRFHQGENAVFAYVIFNGNQSAQLTAQSARLSRWQNDF